MRLHCIVSNKELSQNPATGQVHVVTFAKDASNRWREEISCKISACEWVEVDKREIIDKVILFADYSYVGLYFLN